MLSISPRFYYHIPHGVGDVGVDGGRRGTYDVRVSFRDATEFSTRRATRARDKIMLAWGDATRSSR